MQPGDKVRFLHSKGEGIIRKVLDARTFEVEIEDGFLIPVIKTDLVKVSGEETKIIREKTSMEEIKPDTSSPISRKGIYLSFIPFNDKQHSVILLNQSGRNILFSLFHNTGNEVKGIASGILENEKSIKTGEADITQFESWPEYIIQIIFFSYGRTNIASPLNKRFRFKASSFFKKKQLVPVLNKEGFLIRLDAEEGVKIPSDLAEKMFEKDQEETYQNNLSRPDSEIDLHIEKLVQDHSKMSHAEILELQLRTFESKLDNAIASGMDEIVFIHGVGNGVLKDKIHKLLSQRKNIQFFKDAKKDKFGYGATLVRIK